MRLSGTLLLFFWSSTTARPRVCQPLWLLSQPDVYTYIMKESLNTSVSLYLQRILSFPVRLPCLLAVLAKKKRKKSFKIIKQPSLKPHGKDSFCYELLFVRSASLISYHIRSCHDRKLAQPQKLQRKEQKYKRLNCLFLTLLHEVTLQAGNWGFEHIISHHHCNYWWWCYPQPLASAQPPTRPRIPTEAI